MSGSIRRALYWAPRLLGLGLAGFLAMFALDVFQEGLGFWTTAGVLLIHLVPSAIVLGAVLVGWRRERLGAVFFLALGAAYLVIGAGAVHWLAFAMISGPMFLIGLLFLAGGSAARGRAEAGPGSGLGGGPPGRA